MSFLIITVDDDAFEAVSDAVLAEELEVEWAVCPECDVPFHSD